MNLIKYHALYQRGKRAFMLYLRKGKYFVKRKIKEHQPRLNFDPSLLTLAQNPREIALPAPQPNPALAICVLAESVQYANGLRCLKSIAINQPSVPFTVTILGFFDVATQLLLEDIENLQVVRLSVFPEDIAKVVRLSSALNADQVLMLNAGCVLLPGAIDRLLGLRVTHSGARIVSPKVVNADGLVLYAGESTPSDSGMVPFGFGCDNRNSIYNYVRQPADPSTLACLLVQDAVIPFLAAHFNSEGAHDVNNKYRLLSFYQPMSTVIYDADNAKFRLGKVSNRGPNISIEVLEANTSDGDHRKFVLVVDIDIPAPDRDAGSRTIFEFLKTMSLAGWVVKLWPINGVDDYVYSSPLRELGVEVITGDLRPSFAGWLKRHAHALDNILLSRPFSAWFYRDLLERLDVPIIYYGHDLHFRRLRVEAEKSASKDKKKEADKIEAIERDIWSWSDVSTYPSSEEAGIVSALAPGTIARPLLAYCYDDFRQRTTMPVEPIILFVGGFRHSPNVDGVAWFARNIFPLVSAAIPNAKFQIAGYAPTEEVKALATANIEVLGWLNTDELAATYSSARMAVVPLRFGAGVKLKVVEALREGVPLVTTSVGAQGLPNLDLVIPLHDEIEGMAEAIVRILRLTQEDWLAQSLKQVEYARRHFSRMQMLASLVAAFGAAEVTAQ